ncbi:MAG: hypothetical protein WC340_10130 [Kiritimatiellia bacterium]
MQKFWKCIVSVCFMLVLPARAQWILQEVQLTTGWNAVCLKVTLPDAMCATAFAGSPVEVVSWWCRGGNGEGGFTQSPEEPLPPAPEMRNWYPGNPQASTFFQLIGGESYLIKVSAPVTLQLTGVPALPCPVLFGGMQSLVGLNVPAGKKVMLSEYFAFYNSLKPGYAFSGVNPISASSVLIQPSTVPAQSAAIWVSSIGAGALEYSGPFEVSLGTPNQVVAFQGVVSPQTIIIKNNSGVGRVLHLASQLSQPPPTGQGGVAGAVPLLRAVLDWSAGFPREVYEDLNLPWSTNLAAGAEFELRLLPKVHAMPLSADAYQSVLNISDQGSSDNSGIPGGVRGFYQIGLRAAGDLVEQVQPTGLWVGNVVLDGVNRAQTHSSVSNTWNTAAIQPAQYPFTFRVILHVDEYGVTRLMKEAFLASVPAGESTLLSSRDAALAFRGQHPDAEIRRISSVNFPFADPKTLAGGSFATADAELTVTVLQAHDDKTNPFVHAYHPDHDNVEFRNGVLLAKDNGADGIGDYESWAVQRNLTFTFAENDPIGINAGWNISVAGGTYAETITGLNKTEIRSSGAFRLNKVSDVPRILYVSGN